MILRERASMTRMAVNLVTLFVVSVLLAFLLSPADPISFFIAMALIVALVFSAFWMGTRYGRKQGVGPKE